MKDTPALFLVPHSVKTGIHRHWVMGSTIRLWDARNGATLGKPLQGHNCEVMCVAFGPDGSQVASGPLDGKVRLWEVATGARVYSAIEGHNGPVDCVAFSLGGALLASG